MPLPPGSRSDFCFVVTAAVTDTERPRVEDRFLSSLTDVDLLSLVRAYPLASLAVAASVGFLIGRSRGREVLAMAQDVAGDRVLREVHAAMAPPPDSRDF